MSHARETLNGSRANGRVSPRRSCPSTLQCESAASAVVTNPMTTSTTPSWIAPWCNRTDRSLWVDCSMDRKNPIMPNPKVAKVEAVRIHDKVVRSSARVVRNSAEVARTAPGSDAGSGFCVSTRRASLRYRTLLARVSMLNSG